MNPNEKASSVYLVDINSTRKAILFSSPAAEQMTLEIIKAWGLSLVQSSISLYLGKGWKEKPGGMDTLMCKSLPAEMSLLGSTALSRRRSPFISPFNLTWCSWDASPKPSPCPLPAAHSVPFPVWNAFSWLGWWDDGAWPGVSSPPNTIFSHPRKHL